MNATGLIVARFVHYSALMVLFGAAIFPLYAYRGSSLPAAPNWLVKTVRRVCVTAAATALISGFLWFGFTAARMSGDFSALVDVRILSLVATETPFGQIWIWRLIIIGLTLVLFLLRAPAWTRAGVAAAALASLALVGHASTSTGAMLHLGMDGVHLLAAGTWLGGLLPLGALLARGDNADHAEMLLRFSAVASVAVALLVLTGLVNSWFLVGTFDRLFHTSYGQFLLFKLLLFFGMLCLALINRFYLVPRLARNPRDDHVIMLRRNVTLEQTLGVAILFTVAILGTTGTPIPN